jgi:hypothetical protein
MQPIAITISGHTYQSSEEICRELLKTERWSEFKGFFILPGVKNARFECQTPSLVGSRIHVQNTDGSSHIEEIIEWDVLHKVVLRFQEFNSPLKHLATHFIEVWTFDNSANGTEVSRTMILYPKGLLGWCMLLPIAQLMKGALKKNTHQLRNT